MGKTKQARRAAEYRPSHRLNWHVWAFVALAVAASFWAYQPGFAGVLVLDDVPAISANPHVRSVWPLSKSMSAPSGVTTSGRPIASLSFAINYALAPPAFRESMDPESGDAFYQNIWGYHATNLLIHVLAGLVLFGIVRRTLVAERLAARWAPLAMTVAGAVSLVWLVHPLQTESVTYVVQRCESLMGLWLLLTLYCAIRADAGGPASIRWTAASIVACALGMATKEVMVVAPVVVMIWDRCCGSGRPRWRLYGGLMATWLVLAILLVIGSEGSTALTRGASDWSRLSYLLTQAGVLWHYVRLSFWPTPLAFDYYGWPPVTALSSMLVMQVILLLTAAAATAYGVWRRHALAVCGAVFFLVLAPTSSVFPIPTEIAAEHRMYLPLAALIVIAVVALVRAVDAAATAPQTNRLVAVAALVLATACGAMTRSRNYDYQSEQTLWKKTVDSRPNNARARINYGRMLVQSGDATGARSQMETALALRMDPQTRAAALVQLGASLAAQGHIEAGVVRLKEALVIDPNVPDADVILGQAYADKKEDALAVVHLERSLKARPGNPLILSRLAWILATSVHDDVRDGVRAAQLADAAVKATQGRDVFALSCLGAALAELGRFSEAGDVLRNAIRLAQSHGTTEAVPALGAQLRLVMAKQKIRE